VIRLTEVTLLGLEDICLRLRERDKAEIYNVMDHESPFRLAMEAHHALTAKGRGRIAWSGGRPAGVLGFAEQRRGIWDAIAFGTDDFRSVAVALARYGRKESRAILREVGAIRLQAESRVEHTEAHAFIRALGGAPEGPPKRNFGRDGGAYQTFVWFPALESDNRLGGIANVHGCTVDAEGQGAAAAAGRA
jgi:hypothetical protein